MKKLLLVSVMFISASLIADGHDKKEKNTKERMQNHPNYLISFKDCKETKEGIGGLLFAADSAWKEVEMSPENQEKWEEAIVLVDLAANYSTIYDVWCKDMVNQRMKMRMKADKKKDGKQKQKNKEDN